MFAKIKADVCEVFPYTESNLRQENPYTNYGNNTDFVSIFPTTEAATLHGYSLVEVMIDPPPAFDRKTQTAVQLDPAKAADGTWRISWEVRPLTQAEQDSISSNMAAAVRGERNRRLSSCDWTQVADAPVDKAAWATYRQALRDVPSQPGFPWDIQWPTQPE